ncbi:MAG: hypothetical protein Q9199_006645 [Rusavskia elegans]
MGITPATPITDPLVWIDCEMTGLDVENDEIISLCCFITDAQLNLLDEQGFEAVVHLDKSRLDAMDEWCIATHGRTGLTKASIASTTTAQEAADGLLAYIEKYVPRSVRGLLAGNSVHQDKAFLRKPPFDSIVRYLHYRMLDVSSINEAARRPGGYIGQHSGGQILPGCFLQTPKRKGTAPGMLSNVKATEDKAAEDKAAEDKAAQEKAAQEKAAQEKIALISRKREEALAAREKKWAAANGSARVLPR